MVVKDAHASANYAARLRRVELTISMILRVGVVTSLAIIVAGTLVSFVHHPDYLTSPSELVRLTKPGAAFPRTLTQVVQGLGQLRGQAIVVVGLLLLIATPVARVAASVVGFAYLRERTYVIITTVVLGLLVLSFWFGRVAG